MLNTLRANKKMDLVDGTLSKLVVNSSNIESWISVNWLLVSWELLLHLAQAHSKVKHKEQRILYAKSCEYVA
ncbi:T32E20.34 [Arabidopsis thaliana]|uniref:T32E20.34 n=1 Tax=Arabidopsis thaliana TaxID=3702 RepID=Q9LP86_ARATH|nr:T32E20.34 [Arabidopsis thaliana]